MEPDRITPAWIASHVDEHVDADSVVRWERIGERDGLLSRIYRVRYSGGEPRSFVLKLPPSSGSMWEHLLAEIAPFPREAQTYGLFGPKGADLAGVIPRCLWSSFEIDGTGALALEDLTCGGGFTANVGAGMELGQVRDVLVALAELHAVHAVPGALGRFDHAPVKWMYTAHSSPLVRILSEAMVDCHRTLSERFADEAGEKLLDTMAGWQVAESLTRAHEGSRLLTICHGDVWSNNVMFVPGEGEVDRAVVLDWQFTTWGNPLIDVAFLLMSSLAPDVRDANSADLLSTYYHALRETLAAELEYTQADCLADYDRGRWYGVLMSLCNVEAFLSSVAVHEAPKIVRRLRALVDALPPG